jgi:zinc transport system ATP-binding protein
METMPVDHSEPAISLEHIYVAYDGYTALEDINLKINQLDYLGIIGPNGGGKTTLLKAIVGHIRPKKGRILINGRPPSKARSLLGYVPQVSTFDNQYPISVWDVVLMGRLSKSGFFSRYDDNDKEHTSKALQLVDMFDRRFRQVGDLSGGQIQRVLIARALASSPQILLLDEPTASIDSEIEKGLYDLLNELNKDLTIILVSHDIGAISSHVKSIACLNRKLYHHGSKDLTPEVIEAVYGCPVDLIAHGAPHRVLKKHHHSGN